MRKPAAVLGLGSGTAALVLALAAIGVFDRAELWLYDWRVRQTANPSAVTRDIALVLIDDQTIRDLAPVFGRWPWPRVAHSYLFSFLSRGPARVIAFDVGIWEADTGEHTIAGERWSGAESDAALVEAVRKAGTALLLADATFAGAPDQTNRPAVWRDPGYRLDHAIEPRPLLLPPIQPLTDAAAALGHNFLPLDEDGPARRMPPFVRVGDRYVPSLGIAAALLGGGFRPDEVAFEGLSIRVRDRRIPLLSEPVRDDDTDGQRDRLSMLIRWQAPAEVPSYPAYEARFLVNAENQLLSGEKPDLDPSVFRDKIVFIGTSAAGTHDVFQTPFGSATMPGIQLHASMADSLLTGRFIDDAAPGIRVASVVGLSVIVCSLAILLSYSVGAASGVVLAGFVLWAGVLFFGRGVWINLSQPLAAVALSLFAGTAYRYFVEDREKRKVQRLFGRYVSRDVYAQLLQHPERAELGGARREMTVLFSDIRGFTTVTEKGEPEALVAQLNEYFSRMVEIVFRHGGTVDKFVGDMVMALFGAPLDDPWHAEHAVRAARDMVAELRILNQRWAAEGRPVLDIGVGINSGEMIAGNIGSSSIMSYTVIGDNVNLGSRLESLNKDFGTRIIISDATRVLLTGTYDLRPLGEAVVKGKSRPVAIFEVKVPSPIPSVSQEATL